MSDKNSDYKKVKITKNDLKILKNLKKNKATKEFFVFQRLLCVSEFKELVHEIRQALSIPNNGTTKEELDSYVKKYNVFHLDKNKYTNLTQKLSLPHDQSDKLIDFYFKYRHIFDKKIFTVKPILINILTQYILKNNITPSYSGIYFEKIEMSSGNEGDEGYMKMNSFQIVFNEDIKKEELINFIEKNYQLIQKTTKKDFFDSGNYFPNQSDIDQDILIWNIYLDFKKGKIKEPLSNRRIDESIRIYLIDNQKISVGTDRIKKIRGRFRKYNKPKDIPYYEKKRSI